MSPLWPEAETRPLLARALQCGKEEETVDVRYG